QANATWSCSVWAGPAVTTPVKSRCFTGDLDGDKRVDLWCNNAGAQPNWNVCFSRSTAFSCTTWAGSGPSIPITDQCLTGDLDGDGRTDFWCQTTSYSGFWHVCFTTNTGFNCPFLTLNQQPRNPVGYACTTLDFNGDGRTDFLCENEGALGTWTVCNSTGTG